jgi:hypothetical protein
MGTLYNTTTITTYPDSIITDRDGVVYTPRSDYDDSIQLLKLHHTHKMLR